MAKEKSYEGFTEDERAAMKDRATELKKSARSGTSAKKAETEKQALLDTVAAMPDDDRAIAEALHAIVTKNAPDLAPKTWYGMPAWAKDGQVVLFLKPAGKFKMRYAEVGFSETAQLDDGDIWPTVYAVTTINPAIEKQLTALVKRAAG
ncbi:iron chaperone [Luteipulveratus mongoliensis]|uniref:YdhG-like domain-containing protein n=1 Tax=Luteipulveratus mongoliensis TaxID=571913 RepID=A0A0K1JLK1_9MICO|nr:hypothetical protein [Luteipulveratus mongoliensis]AKU17591.1 hypothetical protein VV02_19965 [Luteipulveratus mongoliensis]